jgi:hypothetical protein
MQNSSTSIEPHPPHSGYFETFFKEDGKYYFQYIDDEGKVIFFGKPYTSEKSRDNGIQAVIRSAGAKERYDSRTNKKGTHFFVLKSGNHKEIGRSVIFDSREEMQEKMELLQRIDEDVAIVSKTGKITPDKTVEVKKKKATPVGKRPSQPKASPVKKEAGPRTDKADQMPRYKFTLIYYPDPGVWMLKNDFSGESRQIKTWNAQVLQQFVKSQFPAEEQASVFAGVSGAKPDSPPAPPVAVPAKQSKEVQFTIHNKEGEPVRQMAASANLGSIELAGLEEGSAATASFAGRVLARSIDHQKEYLLGMISGEKFREGRLVIPILDGNRLTPGSYLFVVDVDQEGKTDDAVKMVGRQILMLN